jgi:hypothetical protein
MDYANLAWHCILDWRLAVEMARLAIDADAPVRLTKPHWQPLTDATQKQFILSASFAGMKIVPADFFCSKKFSFRLLLSWRGVL